MIRAAHKRLTYEDKFDRKYTCNVYRWLHYVKRANRRKMRRILKQEMRKDDAA